MPDLRQCRDKSGTFNLDQSLRILAGGKIVVPPFARTAMLLTVARLCRPGGVDFVMDHGRRDHGQRDERRPAKGIGATINISATGTILLRGDGSTAPSSPRTRAGSCTGRQGRQDQPDGGHEHLDPGRLRRFRRRHAVPGRRITLLATQGK